MSKSKNTSLPIEIWDIDKLVPYEQNAKKHPDDQVSKLARSIDTFGWTQPITVWKNGEIIAGHGRRLAALKLGLKKVPVVVRADLTKAEADALRLADNRVTSTEYDQAMIQDELRRLSDELEGSGIELTDIGYDEKEIDFSLSNLGDIDDSFFTDDVATAVEDQQRKNEASIEDTDGDMAPIGDAIGFKRVTVMQSREIRKHMSAINELTEEEGVDAFLHFLRSNLGAA